MATSVDAKLLRQTKFPPDFSQKVDMQKVNLEVLKKFAYPHHGQQNTANWKPRHRWIASRIAELLGNDDDVVIELCFNLLEGSRFVSKASLSVTSPH